MTAPLLIIVGPTCTGKTRLAVGVATRLGDAELLNADSRQLRRGLRVATCAPTPAELHGITAHLLDLAEPGAPFTVADWLAAAHTVLADLARRGVQPIVVGGTGLYVTALVDGYHLGGAPADRVTREQRNQAATAPGGLAALVESLRARDPAAAEAIDPRNPRRVIRAMEILDAGAGSGGLNATRARGPGLPAVMVGLRVSPEAHQRWVGERTSRMFGDGSLMEEARAALDRGVSAPALAASGIGYAEILSVLDGRCSASEAGDATVARTLRYAKAQRTYFRRDRRIHWLQPDLAGPEVLVDEVMQLLADAPAGGHPTPT